MLRSWVASMSMGVGLFQVRVLQILNGIIDNIDRREEHDSHPSVRRVVCNPLRRLAWRHRKPSCARYNHINIIQLSY